MPWRRPDNVQGFDIDQKTYDLLVTLRSAFGETTNAGVLRKALALANVVVKHARGSNFVTLAGDNGATPDGKPQPPITIHLNG